MPPGLTKISNLKPIDIFFLSINIRFVTFYGRSTPALRLPYSDMHNHKVHVCIYALCSALTDLSASLTQAIQFLIEGQKYQFWIMEEYSKINYPKKFESDILNTFCVTRGLKTQYFVMSISSLLLLPSRQFANFERQFLLEYSTQRDKNVTNY